MPARHPLEALIGAMSDEGAQRHRPSPPDALCPTLREIAARYADPCPFKPGDLVTPRAGGDMKGAGTPHIVLETLERPEPDFRLSDPRDGVGNTFGSRRDMRVACESASSNQLTRFWVESIDFEPYTGPGAIAAQAA